MALLWLVEATRSMFEGAGGRCVCGDSRAGSSIYSERETEEAALKALLAPLGLGIKELRVRR
jgi:hypothetical protein